MWEIGQTTAFHSNSQRKTPSLQLGFYVTLIPNKALRDGAFVVYNDAMTPKYLDEEKLQRAYERGYQKGFEKGFEKGKELTPPNLLTPDGEDYRDLLRRANRYDALLQSNKKLMIHSVHQQDRIDNLECYLSFYLKHEKKVA